MAKKVPMTQVIAYPLDRKKEKIFRANVDKAGLSQDGSSVIATVGMITHVLPTMHYFRIDIVELEVEGNDDK